MRRYGEQHPQSKLKNNDIVQIRELWDIGHRNIKVIARNYGVSSANIKKIVKGSTWKHLIKWPSKQQ
jgi:hypothetical protein